MEEEPLPASFREKMMRRLERETARKRRRNERLAWLSVVLASLGILGLAVAALRYVGGVPRLACSLPEWTSLPFYLHIGAISLLLLTFDHFFRKAYKKR
jgi:fatty acid desaturase